MSVEELRGLVAHASTVPVADRVRLADLLRRTTRPGTVLLETCHRVELHGAGSGWAAFSDGLRSAAPALVASTTSLRGREVVEHVVNLAVGLRSTVVAEDQVLHQLRGSVEAARSAGGIAPELDRLFDHALRAGRRARSWLPGRRPALADVALDVASTPIVGRSVLVVGAGEMGRLAVAAARARGASVLVASRTPERAAALAAELGVATAPFGGGPALGAMAVVIVALRGRWTLDVRAQEVLVTGGTMVIDLSTPSALPARVAAALGNRLVTIDDIVRRPGQDGGDRVVARLRQLAEATVTDYLEWAARGSTRTTAQRLAELAEARRRRALDRLWARLPDLGVEDRGEIEQMTRHLADHLLREPLQRLGSDPDGRRERAAHELFGL